MKLNLQLVMLVSNFKINRNRANSFGDICGRRDINLHATQVIWTFYTLRAEIYTEQKYID
jgi:hypothetical protein